MIEKLTRLEKKHLIAVISADLDYLKDWSDALDNKFVITNMTPEQMKQEAIEFIAGKGETISAQTKLFVSVLEPCAVKWQKRVSKRVFGFALGDILTKLRIHSGRAGSEVLIEFAESQTPR